MKKILVTNNSALIDNQYDIIYTDSPFVLEYYKHAKYLDEFPLLIPERYVENKFIIDTLDHLNFNYKIYFSIIDATCKGLGSPVYEGWLDAVENIQNFTTRSELRISDADVWVLFKDALKEAGLEESDNPLLEVAESVILQMSLNQFVTFYFQGF